jgi:uncharacterized membrane protein
MRDVTIALAIHLLAVVLWIGGVAMVATVLLPAVRRFRSASERVVFFESVERGFARQARVTTLIAGASGFYMMTRLGLWSSLHTLQFWWLSAMVCLWAIFTLMLFVLEPLFLHRWFETRAKTAPESTFALIQRLHWVLLTASVITILGAVAGSHGVSLFG